MARSDALCHRSWRLELLNGWMDGLREGGIGYAALDS